MLIQIGIVVVVVVVSFILFLFHFWKLEPIERIFDAKSDINWSPKGFFLHDRIPIRQKARSIKMYNI